MTKHSSEYILVQFEAQNWQYFGELLQAVDDEDYAHEYSDIAFGFQSALVTAIHKRNRSFIRWVLKNAPSLFSCPPHGWTMPATLVAWNNDIKTMLMILLLGPEDACTDGGWRYPCALEAAIAAGHDEMVAVLLGAGCTVPPGIQADYFTGWDDFSCEWSYGAGDAIAYCRSREIETASYDSDLATRYARIADLLRFIDEYKLD